MKKYEFTGETEECSEATLHRIRAVRDFGNVKAGDIGGWIEGEKNLSHDGEAWVYGEATVWGNAMVRGDAKVCGNADVYGNAKVCRNAKVYGNAEVCGNAYLNDGADVFKSNHVLVIGMIGSRNDFATFYRTQNGIGVRCGCFLGGIEDFLEKVEETHGNNKHAQVYRAAAELAKIQIGVD